MIMIIMIRIRIIIKEIIKQYDTNRISMDYSWIRMTMARLKFIIITLAVLNGRN